MNRPGWIIGLLLISLPTLVRERPFSNSPSPAIIPNLMSLTAAILIIVSAFMHAGWNFISKRRSPSLAFFFLTAVFAALTVSPVLIIYRGVLELLPTAVWIMVLGTGISQTIYFFGLAGAYRQGDISLAYPLVRALPVLMVAGVSLLLSHTGEVGNLALAGMILITAGCIILPLHNFQELRLHNYLDIVILMSLVAAIGTTGYTLFDDQALRQLRASLPLTNSQVTLLFIPLQTGSTALMLGLATLFSPTERRQLRQLGQNRRLLLTSLLTGIIIMSTYGLVLAAMAYVTNVSYVAAFRQLSIPIGAVLGLTLQQEPRYAPKLLGIGVVSVGLILVGIG
ncbi:MAG: multidrug DMT transporter permease [Ardenticatenaceae bacterium]|nr:multidrug DMT transporter permease [Ardenticatenaceae bacterium]